MLKLLKSVLACAVAAFVSCFLFMEWLDYGVNAALSWPRIVHIILTPSWMTIGIISALTFVLMAIIGLPLRALFLKPPRSGLFWHVGLGIAITTVLLAILVLPACGFISILGILTLFEVFPAAILATVIFWLIRRPDKDVQVCEIKDRASCT